VHLRNKLIIIIIIIIIIYYEVFLFGVRWRHSKPPNSVPHFWSIFNSLRNDGIANYASI